MEFQLEISIELREECVKLFKLCDEFSSPASLRAFVHVEGMELVRKCIVHSDQLDFDQLISKMLGTGRSFLEPALFDLLDALAVRYEEDAKGQACKELKEKLRKAIPQPEDPDQANDDYQRLVQSRVPSDGQGIAQQAQRWVERAGNNLDELALRITLAVFNGTSFEVIERAKSDLLELLQQILPPPNPETPPPLPGIPVPLMRRLKEAGADETDPKPPDWRIVIELHNPDLASEALSFVWQLYREKKWRQQLIKWLTSYAAGRPVDVRTRAAVAAGRLAITDYGFVRDNLLSLWVWAGDRQSEYRTAIGMALGVLIREEKWAGEVQNLLNGWSSGEQAERWAATRAYIYVGAYCRSVSEVIARWRCIAASEKIVVNIQLSGNLYLRLTNPLHMSLVEAMMRFFTSITQLPDEEKRLLFEGALEGLQNWIAADSDDACLGLFIFTTLGRMIVSAGDEQVEGPPVLLHLVEEQSAQSHYRKRLARLFYLTLRQASSVIEAKDLLCMWLEKIESLQIDSHLYEARTQALLMDIIAADNTGRIRGQLIACLQDCGRKGIAGRIIASL